MTWVLVSNEYFSLSKGEELLRWFQSSAQSKRGFCSQCGSSLFFTSTLCPNEVHIARASILGDVEEPKYHCFVDEKVDWVEIDDTLIQLDGDSPQLSKYQSVTFSR